MKQRKKIVVIGAGVSGIVAAYVIARAHDVTLLEKNDYLGGHTNTIVIEEGADRGMAIDTGFIVCNQRNYPNFYAFLAQLGVSLLNSDMSFSFYCDRTGFGYSGPTMKDFLRRPSNLVRPSFLKMLLDQHRFNQSALRELENPSFDDVSLGVYVEQLGLSRFFIEHYLVPLAAAIWSSPDCAALDIPSRTFLRFFKNHGMLETHTMPQWQVLSGGSHTYIKAFRSAFRGKIKLNASVKGIRRTNGRVLVFSQGESVEEYDALVLATHADQSLRLLEDPTPQEQALLGSWRYQENSAVLHTDTKLLPPKRTLWSSWNYRRQQNSDSLSAVQISYYMNRLQRLKSDTNYIVTLNRDAEINPRNVIYKTTYTHPQYNMNSVRTQAEIETLNGDLATFYCGSYLGYGFHEDGVSSALKVASKFGLQL